MADRSRRGPKKLESELLLWRDFGGSITRDGTRITKPVELANAEILVGLCDRFRALPDTGGILDQDVALVRMLRVIDLGVAKEGGPGA